MTTDANLTSIPLNILLVEDDDGDAKAIQRLFAKARIANQIRRAVDGIEALEILRGTNGKVKIERPYLLMVDLNLPRVNGLQLIKALREDQDLRHAIVFVLTTSKRDEDKMAAYNLNVTGYVLKDKAGENFLSLFGLVECYWRIVEMP